MMSRNGIMIKPIKVVQYITQTINNDNKENIPENDRKKSIITRVKSNRDFGKDITNKTNNCEIRKNYVYTI